VIVTPQACHPAEAGEQDVEVVVLCGGSTGAGSGSGVDADEQAAQVVGVDVLAHGACVAGAAEQLPEGGSELLAQAEGLGADRWRRLQDLGQHGVGGHGGYSTSALARADLAAPVPEHLDAVEVAALPLNYATAWQMLHRCARVLAGGSILVLGAAGGVGSALCELALQSGLTVYGTASAARRAHLAEQGAHVLEDRADLPTPVDAVFDSIGGPSLALSRRATKPGGTVVAYGISHASTAELSKTRTLATAIQALARAKVTRGARVVSFTIGASTKKDPAGYAHDLAHLVELLADGQLHPGVQSLPLTDAAEAHRRLEGRRVLGKLVLTT